MVKFRIKKIKRWDRGSMPERAGLVASYVPAMAGASATTSGRSKLIPSLIVGTLRMIISRQAPELPPTSTSVATPWNPPSKP